MNKRGIFFALLATIFIVPQLAFAAWWNPLSWFNNWQFSAPVPVQEIPKTEPINQPVKLPEEKPENTATSTATTTPKIKPKPIVSVPVPKPKKSVELASVVIKPPVIDVCANIEGIQTTVPTGMSLSGTNCSVPPPVISTTPPPPPIDVCANIEGVQTTIPGGMTATGNVCIATTVNQTNPLPPYPLPMNPPPTPPSSPPSPITATVAINGETLRETHFCIGTNPTNLAGITINRSLGQLNFSPKNPPQILSEINYTLTLGGQLGQESDFSRPVIQFGWLASDIARSGLGNVNRLGDSNYHPDWIDFRIQGADTGTAQLTINSMKLNNGDQVLGLPVSFVTRTFATSSVYGHINGGDDLVPICNW